MTWLVSMLLAGAIFSSGNLPLSQGFVKPEHHLANLTDETERFEQTYSFSPTGKIEVSNVNGSITIDTWDSPQIKLEVVKTANSKEALADLTVNIEATLNNFSVDVDYGNWKNKGKWNRNSNLEASFHLTVPRTAVLNEIQTVNGSVTIDNSNNYTKASTVNGTVQATRLQGNSELSTVNGTVLADYEKLFSGNLISLSTVNGRASLTIPSDANATLRAESLNGKITNDFGLPVRKGEYVGRDMYGKVGTGEVKIKLESVNGELEVRRKNDGKTPNPATNLLSPKNEKDGDENFDNDFAAAVRNSNIDLREARREIERARKEMKEEVRSSSVAALSEAKAKLDLARANMNVEIPEIPALPELSKVSEEAIKQAIAAIDSAKIPLIPNPKFPNNIRAAVADKRFPWRAPFMEEKSRTYQIKGIPAIKLEASNCSVSVRGWDKPEVKYSLSKVSSNVSQKPIEFSAVQINSGSIEIKALNPNEAGGYGLSNRDSIHVQLEVFVPKKSNLKIITDDEVRLEGVSGDIELQGKDEAINIRDSEGKLTVKAEDGIVRLIGFKGELDASLQDGEMFLEGDFLKLRAAATDGTIVLTVPQDTNANIVSDSESVDAEGISMLPEDRTSDKKNRWRLGKGGKEFEFRLTDGAVMIRGQNTLSDFQ
jgi:DUF4097 and DUF4098 domain-containing protein YvlB